MFLAQWFVHLLWSIIVYKDDADHGTNDDWFDVVMFRCFDDSMFRWFDKIDLDTVGVYTVSNEFLPTHYASYQTHEWNCFPV